MSSFAFARKAWFLGFFVVLATLIARAQNNYATEGMEYNIGGALPGEQMYPNASIKTTGGYIVWQDNITDGAGLGISARKLDSSLSSTFSAFRVNQNGNADQERPSVSMFNSGGAVFTWEGGKQGFQHIYARFLSAAGTWLTGDIMVSTRTNVYQLESSVTTLANSNVVVIWSSFNQASTNSLRDVYFQILGPTGSKIGTETRVNQATAFNQRSAAIAPLANGKFVVVWASEQQRVENGVDIYGRVFDASGEAFTDEILINTGTSVCASPSVARSPDGGFGVAWMQKDVNLQTRSNSWDIFVRPFDASRVGGTARRVNTWVFGDQLGPKIAALGTDYLVTWTSMGQDGSREGIYGQFLRADGTLSGAEFRVNTTIASQQIQPAVASDGVARFLTLWSSYAGGTTTFDLYAQRYVSTSEALPAPGAPMVSALSSNSLSVSWEPVQGFNVASYEVYADGSLTATVTVTSNYWTVTGLAPSSTHSYRVAYVLADGRRSPRSSATSGTTYSGGATWGGIPQEWMISFFGDDIFSWPSPFADSDGDGASNKDEFFAGTNPTDANSVLRIRFMQTAQGPYVTWNAQPGFIYQVQKSVHMGPWQNYGGPRFAAGYLDSVFVGGGDPGFYRIQRLR